MIPVILLLFALMMIFVWEKNAPPAPTTVDDNATPPQPELQQPAVAAPARPILVYAAPMTKTYTKPVLTFNGLALKDRRDVKLVLHKCHRIYIAYIQAVSKLDRKLTGRTVQTHEDLGRAKGLSFTMVFTRSLAESYNDARHELRVYQVDADIPLRRDNSIVLN